MKALFSFLLFYCFATADFKAQAQAVFAPVGAEWWYYNNRAFDRYWQYEVLYQYRVTKDTIVMEQPCRAISPTAYMRTQFPPAVYYDTADLRTLYVYDNTDTVFIFNEIFNRFTPLYVFNAKEGDTICLPVIPAIIDNNTDMRTHPITGDRSFCFMIDSVRMVTYDTTTLKTFYNHFFTGGAAISTVPTYNWSSYFFLDALSGSYAEKIGGIGGGLLPVLIGEGIERPAAYARLDNMKTTIRCYSDSTVNIKVVSGTCDSLYPVPVNIAAQPSLNENISIYPNPAKEKVTLESLQNFPPNTVVVLTDIAGKAIKSLQPGTGKTVITMELDNVQAGIYLLRIDAGKYSVNHKLIVQD